MGAKPFVLPRMSEEQVLVISVLEPREAGGDADQHLLDAAELPAPEARVDADPKGAHRDPATSVSGNPRVRLARPGVRGSSRTGSINALPMETSSDPIVSIVIPNRDGATPRDGLIYLEMVLEILAQQSFRYFDVTVVDNGSTDGSVEYLRQHWPEVRVVPLPQNTGFPAAINRGVDVSRGRYIALLNNDLELSPDWLELLVAELDRDPGIGFVTGKIMRYDDRDVIEQAGHDFFTCGHFEPVGLDQKDSGQYDERRATTVVTAAAALYRREALNRAGGFDEDYFLYCEDGDVCLRMLLCGYSGLYVPEPKAFHVRGGTVGDQTELPRFYIVRNTLITLLKDMPASILLRSLPKIARYHYGQLVAARKARGARTVLRAYASFLRAVPATLRKRRAIQRVRTVDLAEFATHPRTDYPMPTRLERFLR
jgi:GT2 family glycosyltransferase